MSDKNNKIKATKSIFEKNFNQLPPSKKEKLKEKFSCSICFEIIKNENPYFCYECQKIFHHSCLKNWDKTQEKEEQELSCPNCRYELPLEEWKVLLNFDENRTQDAKILNKMAKKYNPDEFTKKAITLFKKIIKKINKIHSLIESNKNDKLTNLIEKMESNTKIPSIDDISNIIIEELKLIKEYIRNIKKDFKVIEKRNTNEINLKYKSLEENTHTIFGSEFVENNKNNITLKINGKQSPLISKYKLNKGENDITICIKNKLTNLSNMFKSCGTLYNIDELKYLNTKFVTDFSYMFSGSSISNIKALENWDVSKVTNFQYMFSECIQLSNITPLKNWNVSSGTNFKYMFKSDSNISNIKPLENWDISHAMDLESFFSGLIDLTDLTPIQNWNVSKCQNLGSLFHGCENLSDLTPIQNWNVSKCKSFKSLFNKCKKISDLLPLKNWNVSNGTDFSYMFYSCSLINDVKPLENWDVSKGDNFAKMFSECKSLKKKDLLQNWKLSDKKHFNSMFIE